MDNKIEEEGESIKRKEPTIFSLGYMWTSSQPISVRKRSPPVPPLMTFISYLRRYADGDRDSKKWEDGEIYLTLQLISPPKSELRNCVKVAVLGSPSLTVIMVSADVDVSNIELEPPKSSQH